VRVRSLKRPSFLPRSMQLQLSLNSVALQGLSAMERDRVVAQLANLLLRAAGVPAKEHDDDQRH
jgi:hypothetical protein